MTMAVKFVFSIVLICYFTYRIVGHTLPRMTHCEFYNNTCTSENGCNDTEECGLTEPDKKGYCFALWQNSSGKIEVKMKGCFFHSECGQSRCVEKSNAKKDLMFCCCDGNMCNREFSWDPAPPPPPDKNPEKTPPQNVNNVILILLVVILILFFVFPLLYYILRRKKSSYFNEVPTMEPHPLAPSTPNMGLLPIQLIEVKAKGRFGAVWKAQHKTDVIAVKVFPIQDKSSWQVEQQIYALPQMRHDCILRYIAAEKHGDGLQTEFWLITAYHDFGSLSDYLKANVITWTQLCKIASTMAKGLMHVHEEFGPGPKGEGQKPAIAHRDFKSKNVLLKADLTACLADFGLALVFQPGKPCGDTHGQVGTRRYMAPEVLEGAIIFSRDHFLRIDMYAFGLVLWELASRCTAQDGPVAEYQLPFEEEVGAHPTLEDMQECVVNKKQRPVLSPTWKSHSGLVALGDTMEECWDQDAEARLSASCVMERIASQSKVILQKRLINDSNIY